MQSTISDYVRQYDRDHFICSLFIPKSVRQSYLAIYALNIAINNIIYGCNEAMVALVRLQWWHERISIAYNDKVVFDNQMISEGVLISNYFNGYEQMIGKISDENVHDMEKIAEQTTVNLIKMLFTVAKKDYQNNQLAYHCGSAWHLMNNLRNAHVKQFSKIRSIIARIEYHIAQVDNLIKTAPKAITKITLQVKLVALYLKRIRKMGFENFSKEISPIMQIKMLFYSLLTHI